MTREGLEETLTLTRLGIRSRLKKTLQSTNPIESMIEIVRRTSRNVKRWQSGDMCLLWTAAGMLEAEQQFRKIIGYRDLAKLAIAVEHDVASGPTPPVPPPGRPAAWSGRSSGSPTPTRSSSTSLSPGNDETIFTALRHNTQTTWLPVPTKTDYGADKTTPC